MFPSQLVEPKQGLPARGINLADCYDIYRPETWESLKSLQRIKKPKKLWFSLPCTKFLSMDIHQLLNSRTQTHPQERAA